MIKDIKSSPHQDDKRVLTASTDKTLKVRLRKVPVSFLGDSTGNRESIDFLFFDISSVGM